MRPVAQAGLLMGADSVGRFFVERSGPAISEMTDDPISPERTTAIGTLLGQALYQRQGPLRRAFLQGGSDPKRGRRLDSV